MRSVHRLFARLQECRKYFLLFAILNNIGAVGLLCGRKNVSIANKNTHRRPAAAAQHSVTRSPVWDGMGIDGVRGTRTVKYCSSPIATLPYLAYPTLLYLVRLAHAQAGPAMDIPQSRPHQPASIFPCLLVGVCCLCYSSTHARLSTSTAL